jgi:hypothetical protein
MFADEICDSIPDAKERAKCRERAAKVLRSRPLNAFTSMPKSGIR